MEDNYMTTAKAGSLASSVPDSEIEISTDQQCTTGEGTESHGGNNVTKDEGVKMADDDDNMLLSKTSNSNDGNGIVNGEVDMANLQPETSKSEATLENADTSKASAQSSVQGDIDHDDSSMDVDDISSTTSSREVNPMIRHVFLDGSETTDSRDSFSVSGALEIEGAMDVDVVTSSSQDNHSKISDDTDTIASLDSQQSNESVTKTGRMKRPPKPKGTPWIPLPNLPYELDHGYRILRDLMGDKCKSFNWPFMDPVDVEALGLWDYHDKVKQPMWLRKIQFKFVDGEYQSITEFVSDVRVVLENCYRYNGMKHWVSKQAQTLESTLQQKLALLPRELHEKTTLYVTSRGKYGAEGMSFSTSSGRRRFSGRTSSSTADYSPLATSVRKDMDDMNKESKRQQIINRKEEIAQYYVDLIDWEKKLMTEDGAQFMEYMWEIPFIGHFLYMCQTTLCLDEVSYYELERAFGAPRESSLLRRIYTSLLSTPYQRSRLDKKPTMPYKVWEAKLREEVRYWYIVLKDEGSVEEASKSLGIPEQFFEVLGEEFMLDHKRYHELSFYERVWLMKALCDYVYETQFVIKKTIDAQPIQDQRQMVLGYDRDNNAYIHFPQFCGADLRIYRQAAFPEPEIKVKPPPKVETKPEEVQDDTKMDQTKSNKDEPIPPEPTPATPPRSRPSRLRKKINPVLRHGINSEKEVKAAADAKRSSEDKNNDDNNMQDENSSEMKDNVDNESLDKVENNKDAEEKCATDSQSANTDPSGNDNNSNNRTTGGEPEANASDIVQIKSKDSEQVSPDEKCVVSEQTDDAAKDDTVSPQNDSTTERTEQPCPVDSDKSDTKPSSDMLSKTNISTESDETQMSSKDGDSGIEAKDNVAQDNAQTETSAKNNEAQTETGETPIADSETVNKQSDNQTAGSDQLRVKTTPDDQITEGSSEQQTPQPAASILSSPLASPTRPMFICWSPPRPASPMPEREEVTPAVEDFELVCDSVETLRALVKKFSGEPEEIIIPAKGKKKQKTILSKPPRRKRCEIDLHQRLSVMLFELEPWEGKLTKAATRTREKLNKEVLYYQPPDPEKIIKDVWASEEEPSSESESESSSDSDTTSDSDSDSIDGKEMEKVIKKVDIKPEIASAVASAAQAEVAKKPEEPDSTLAIVDSVLEHEIPARRTRLARKRHIHMLKSAKKAAAKSAKAAAANGQATNREVSSDNTGAGPSKKPRVSIPPQTKLAAQPMQITLGTGPGGLSASLPMYSVLKSSNVLNTGKLCGNMIQPGAIRMPVTQTQVSSQNPTVRYGTPLILHQTGVTASQPSTIAGSSNPTPAAAVLAKTPAGNNVRYISLADLAKLNPALAQNISVMSAQTQQLNKQVPATSSGGIQQLNINKQAAPATSSGNTMKLGSPPAPALGSVPGITCIMKSPSKTVAPCIIDGAQGVETYQIQRTQNATGITSVATSITKPSQSENVAVTQGPVGAGVQQVGLTSATASLGQAITTTVNSNAVTLLGQTKSAASLIAGVRNPLLQTVQSPPAGQPHHLSASNVPPPAYKAATQIVSASHPLSTTLSSAVGTVHPGLPARTPQVLMGSAQPKVAATAASVTGVNPVLGISRTNTAVPVTNTSLQPNVGPSSVAASGGTTKSPAAKTTYTITVDANMWKQLQGKPQLQQQVILNHIRQKQLQQQQLIQQQLAAAVPNKAISSPTKTVLQNQSPLQQQSVTQNKLTASPVKTVIHISNPQQQLLQQQKPVTQPQPLAAQQPQLVIQQPVVRQPVTVSTPGQPNTQPQVMLSLSQLKQLQQAQPAKQIIKMSPVKNPAVQGNQQLTAVQGNQQLTLQPQQASIAGGSMVQLTHTQQTQQQGNVVTSVASPAMSSPVRIYLPMQQKPGGGQIQLKAAQPAGIQQQVLRLQNPQQIQGRTLTLSPSNLGIGVQQPSVLINPKPAGQVAAPSLTAAAVAGVGIQPSSQPHPGISLTLSPSKKPGMVTLPLSAFMSQQQVKHVKQQVKPLLYVLPSGSAAPVQTSQGSQGVVLQGVRSLPQPAQGTQNVVMMQSNLSSPPVQRLVTNPNVTLPQTVQGTQNTAVLTQPIQGQAQTRNVVQLLQQARGQPNANILLSTLQNQGANISQVTRPVTLASQVVLPATQSVNITGASNQSTGATVTTGAQHLHQSLATIPAPVAQPSGATVLPQPGQMSTSNDTAGDVEQRSKQSLSAQDKSAQQTFQ